MKKERFEMLSNDELIMINGGRGYRCTLENLGGIFGASTNCPSTLDEVSHDCNTP